MIIGCLKEVKDNENRVGLTPSGAKALTAIGKEVLVQKNAGKGALFTDKEYEKAGAKILEESEEICKKADLIVKVKEPVQSEYPLLKILKEKTLFTYLHLTGVERELTEKLLENKIKSLAYETVEDEKGKLPLLEPMSDVAGGLAVQFGAQYLQLKYAGKGKSLTSIAGVEPAKVVVVGGGTVGSVAAKKAAGLGAQVTLFDKNKQVIRELEKYMPQNVKILYPDYFSLAQAVKECDLLIGAVLIPGDKAPRVVSEDLVKSMEDGSVIVDVAIDQGGCIWGSKPTTHSSPTYKLEGKTFCCITNMPGQVAPDSTRALTNATLPYLVRMAENGVEKALLSDEGFLKGLNTYNGKITCEVVAKAFGLEYNDPKTLLSQK